MKEQERQLLQDLLHQEVLRRIVLLQSWLRTVLYRRYFLNLRQAAVIMQVGVQDLLFMNLACVTLLNISRQKPGETQFKFKIQNNTFCKREMENHLSLYPYLCNYLSNATT